MNVVEIRSITLNDIPGQLRALADRIDVGEQTKPARCIVIAESDDGELICFAWGDLPNKHSCVGLMQTAVMVSINTDT